MAPGFCTCQRDAPGKPHLHPPAGASWHYLCDKPVLAYALDGPPAERPADAPEYEPGDGEAQRIAEVYAEARAEQDRGL